MSARASNAIAVLALAFMTSAAAQEGIERRRPQAAPREAPQPEAPTPGVAPPPANAPGESLPVDDRWRILKSLGLMPYRTWDPYNPNVRSEERRVGKEGRSRWWRVYYKNNHE